MNWQCFTHHTLWPQLNVRVSLCARNILSSFEHEYISWLKIHRIILVSILYITFEFFNSVPLTFLLFPGMVCQFLKNLFCTSFHWFFGLLRQHIAGRSLCCDGLQASINLQPLSLCSCRSGSFVLTQPSGQQTCQQSSKRPGGDSALTSMTNFNAPRPSSGSCRPSWALTQQSTRKSPRARGRCRPTCARTERRTPTWLSPLVLSRGLWPGTAVSI